ncbi:MAG TPA: tRNA (adenosine(37)-N6)-threonylcarbamoyltransferase complex ATPase subunit type 1 TsaE [Alphaproteobacteria bacterium]|nr:tRNA (adenosine(37)-N6)-threonylcarbamoyltransferase complex ATPase subunit type 1 TsaE [Alphaproteobacteria bacterium]
MAARISSSYDLILRDLKATEALGARLAAVLESGDVVGLKGPLGSGKTTLARAVIAALGGTEEVPSPTFTLVQIYELARGPLWHVDLYRLERAEDALELGLEEALAEAIVLIEWPEKLGPLLPADRLEITLSPGGAEEARRVRLTAFGRWRDRLKGLTASAEASP